MSSLAIAQREQGRYPVSIATSLALEAAWGVYPDRPETPPPILAYESVWFNIRTLFRNLLGSMPREAAAAVTPEDIASALATELEIIRSVASAESSVRKAYFYVSNYRNIERKYPHATVRRDTTEKQRFYTALQTAAIEELLSMEEDIRSKDVFVYDLDLRPTKRDRSLILTHYPYDLLSYRAFTELVLLESHTGAIKPRGLWYTKYLNGKDLLRIPFREDLLQVFGDAETFHPMHVRVRESVIELAEQHNWSQLTTTDKIHANFDTLKNPLAKEVLKKL